MISNWEICPAPCVDTNKGNLENVCSKTLNASVHCLALTCLTDAEIGIVQFRNLSTTTEQGFGVALGSGFLNGVVHVLLHIWKSSKVRIENLARFTNAYSETLTQSECFHSICKTVRNHFGLRAHVGSNGCGINSKNTSCSSTVNVDTARKRIDQAGVIGQVGNAAKFNLVVVGNHEHTTFAWHKSRAEYFALIGPNGNVVQVRGVAT